jgi:hypothetical protein
LVLQRRSIPPQPAAFSRLQQTLAGRRAGGMPLRAGLLLQAVPR